MVWPNPKATRWGIGAAGVLAAGILAVLVFGGTTREGPETPSRVSFQIATGSTSGTYFPVAEFLAGMLSHPPGIGRCETAHVCGPAGLIVNTRASEGSTANVIAVNAGLANSGLAQADVVDMALKGRGPFRRSGAAKNLRVIANLYGEAVHLLATTEAKILNVSDLRGKRVSLSTEGSGTIITARAVLRAYGLNERRIVPNYDTADIAVELMREGKLDAMFFVGGTPVTLVEQLLEQNVGVLIPIDGPGRERLLKAEPHLRAELIPQGVYTGSPPIDTVSVSALWITNVSQPADLIYGIARALYNPRNRVLTADRKVGSSFLDEKTAAQRTVAPLHEGALRYFTERGIVPQS